MTSAEDGNLRVVDDPPLIVHFSDAQLEDRLRTLAKTYRSSIRDDLRALLNRYTFVDFARKVVGVGSVGTRCYIVLFRGNHDEDPLFLQIKEAIASVLEPYAGQEQVRQSRPARRARAAVSSRRPATSSSAGDASPASTSTSASCAT